MKIRILSNGPGLKEVVEAYGHSSEWIPASISGNHDYIIDKAYNNEFTDISESDVFIITGSKYSVYDNNAWILKLEQFINKIISSNKPILGICFGHQIIAKCLGGFVEKNSLGWELGSYNLKLTSAGSESKLFNQFNNNDIVYESHQDVVSKLPPGSIELAYTSKGNQSFKYGDCIYGVQFHPEFSYEVTRKLMDLRLERGIQIDSNDLVPSKNSKNILNNFIKIAEEFYNEKTNI